MRLSHWTCYDWRPECFQPTEAEQTRAWKHACEIGHVSRGRVDLPIGDIGAYPDITATQFTQRIVARLKDAFDRGRITSDEHRRLQPIVEEYVSQTAWGHPPKPNFERRDSEALWRARILQRTDRPMLRVSLAVLLWVAVYGAIRYCTNSPRLLIAHRNFPLNPGMAVPAVLAFFCVRMLFNKWCKGEWLPDEALAQVRNALFVAVPALLLSAFGTLLDTDFRPFWAVTRETLAGLAIIILIAFVLDAGLRWLGRSPYHDLGYWTHRWG
jgi:hypothetical protein